MSSLLKGQRVQPVLTQVDLRQHGRVFPSASSRGCALTPRATPPRAQESPGSASKRTPGPTVSALCCPPGLLRKRLGLRAPPAPMGPTAPVPEPRLRLGFVEACGLVASGFNKGIRETRQPFPLLPRKMGPEQAERGQEGPGDTAPWAASARGLTVMGDVRWAQLLAASAGESPPGPRPSCGEGLLDPGPPVLSNTWEP